MNSNDLAYFDKKLDFEIDCWIDDMMEILIEVSRASGFNLFTVDR